MATNGSSCVTHVIFDLDGLLLDTEPIYFKVNEIILAQYGKKYTLELKVKTMGMPKNRAIAEAIEYVGLTGQISIDEYSTKYEEILRDLLPDNNLLPGAMRIVEYFHKNKIPLAICTGSCQYEYDMKMQKHKELDALIPFAVLTGDDPEVKHGKPDPDGFLVTMNRFKEKPSCAANVLVFEDSPNGVIAACRAGMQVVMVSDFSYYEPPEECKDRIVTMNSLEDFKPEQFGLPPFI